MDMSRWECKKKSITSDDRRCDEKEEVDYSEGDKLEDMIHDVKKHFMNCPHLIESLKDDVEKSLYVGCLKFTKLSVVLRLYNLKSENGWSDKSFMALLSLLKDMLSENNKLPDRIYDAKKIMCSMGLNYERIHVCPNDYIFIQKELCRFAIEI